MLLEQEVHLQVHPTVAAHAAAVAAIAAVAAAALATASITTLAAIPTAHAAWLPPDRRRGLLHDQERVLRWRHHLDQERVRCRRHGA